MGKTTALPLMNSVTAVFIMNLTCFGRVDPDLPCTAAFDGDEWQILYCLANRTRALPSEARAVAEAVEYVGRLGSLARRRCGGPPGVKTIWRGLRKIYTLLEYRDMFNIVGQV